MSRSRGRRLAASIIVAVLACALPQVAAAETVPLPAGALTGSAQYDDIYGTSCPAAGACVAVGWYEDSTGNSQALIETQSAYAWSAQQASLASLPGGVYSNPLAELDDVSCYSAGNCVAVGDYADASNHVQGLIDTETNGMWTASRLNLTGLPSVATDPEVNFSSISCPTSNFCVAVGSYNDGAGHEQALIALDHSGTWGVQEADLSSFTTYSNPYAQLTQVSCASLFNCVAVGSFRDAADDDEGLIETLTGSGWVSGRPDLSHLGNAASPSEDILESVSCPLDGSCTAVGFYLDNSGGGGSDQGMLLTQTGGGWAPATEAQLPSNANTTAGAQFAGLSSVSCVTTGYCSAVGSYVATSASNVEAYGVTETAGTWSSGSELDLPQDAATNPDAYPSSISCTAPGYCVAAGAYSNSSGHFDALVAQQSAGSWTTAGVPQPTSIGALPITFASVACAGSGYCAVGGSTLNWSAPNNDVSFLLDAPQGVSSPSTGIVNGTQVQVSWTPPADTGGLPLTGYAVTYNHGIAHGTLEVGASSTSATFGRLTSGDAYTFTVTPLTLLGNGQPVTTAAVTVPFSTQKVRSSLAGLLVPQGTASRLKKLAKTHLYTFTYKPLEPGTVSVRWYETTGRGKHKRKHLFASGSAVATSVAAVKVPVRLTGFGKRAVRAGKRLYLSATVTFVGGGSKVTRTHAFTLH